MMPPKIHDTPEFRAMWFSGMPVWQIADTLGVTRPAVSQAAARFGLPKRKPGRRAAA